MTALEHAKAWLRYEATGLSEWKNIREMKKHKPSEEMLQQARQEETDMLQ